jgi:hypothetical protein
MKSSLYLGQSMGKSQLPAVIPCLALLSGLRKHPTAPGKSPKTIWKETADSDLLGNRFAVRTHPEDKHEMECAQQAEDQAISWFTRWFS